MTKPDFPGYWMAESSGQLAPVVHRYLQGVPLTPEDVATMRAYLRQWVGSSAWDQNPHATDENRARLANLRSLVDAIHTRQQIKTFINMLVEDGIDPL